MTRQTLAEIISKTEGARSFSAGAQELLKDAIDDPFHSGPCDEIAGAATDVSNALGELDHALASLEALRFRIAGEKASADGRPVIVSESHDVPDTEVAA